MEDSAPVNLDDLTAKQRLKEFKTTIKDVKAKDASKKMSALEKCKRDPRYLLEGEALAPFLESLVPKKKTLEQLQPALETLVHFLLTKGDAGQSHSVEGARLLLRTCESLEVLGVLAEVAVFQEEPKKPPKVKKLKKGEEAPPPPPAPEENPTVVRNRYLSCQSLSLIAKALYTADDAETLVAKFVAIPCLLQSLCRAMAILSSSLKVTKADEGGGGESDRASSIAALGFVLDALLMVLRNGAGATAAFLEVEGIVPAVTALLSLDELSLKALQVFQFLSSQEIGIVTASEESLVATAVSMLSRSAAGVVEAIAKTSEPVSKKDAKKEAKKDVGGTEERDWSAVVRRELAVLVAAVDLLTAVAQGPQRASFVRAAEVSAVLRALASVALHPQVWVQCNVQPTVKPDPCTRHLVRNIAILLGSYALVSEDIRVSAVDGGAVRALLGVLEASSQVVGGAEQEGAEEQGGTSEGGGRLHELRHVLEKGVLHLTTVRLPPASALRKEGAGSGGAAVRWSSCVDFVTDCEALRSTASAGGQDLAAASCSLGLLVDLLASEDSDLVNRSCRVLSLLLMGTTNNDPVTLLRDLQLDGSVAERLAAALLSRAGELAAEVAAGSLAVGIEQLQVAESAAGGVKQYQQQQEEEEEEVKAEERSEKNADDVEDKEAEIDMEMDADQEELSGQQDEVEKEKEGAEQMSAVALQEQVEKGSSVGAPQAKVRIQPPRLPEVLCSMLCCLEYLVNASESHVAVVCSEDVVRALAALLNRCGPTCSAVAVPELVAGLRDPRRHAWNTEVLELELDCPGDQLLLREVIFDVLTALASSDAKYRDFAGATLPQQPCSPFPESSSLCAAEALRVFTLASPPCLLTLLCSSEFVVHDQHLSAAPRACPGSSPSLSSGAAVVSREVTDAALRLLHAVAGAGVPGIAALYTAIAASGFEAGGALAHDREYSPLAYFQSCLLAAQLEGPGCQEEDGADFVWKFPSLFQLQQNESNSCIVTHASEVHARKQAWPFLVTAGALLGILASPHTMASTASLAINAARCLSRITNIADDIQPAAADMFSGCLLALGGGVALSGCMGLFGPLQGSEEGVAWLSYLVQRGSSRQQYWDQLLEQKRVAAEALREEELQAAATKDKKGGGGKKDDAKGKAVAGKATSSEQPGAGAALPFEPDEGHADPNHGPGAASWAALLNVGAPDLHASMTGSQPLVAAVQGGLSALAQDMVLVGASVNAEDCFGLAALNHSLLLGYSDVSAALILAGADVNHLDGARNSVMKYCFFAVTSADELGEVYQHCRGQAQLAEGFREGLGLWGGPTFFVQELLAAGADLNVSDEKQGDFLLHNAVGMGSLEYMLGGVRLTVKSRAHKDDSQVSVSLLRSLVSAGVDVNSVNRAGVSALHTLCGLGDLAALQVLLAAGAHPNIVDANGFMPLHYLSAACPKGSTAVASALLAHGALRPKYRLPYHDARTGKSPQEKFALDAEQVLGEVLGCAHCPPIVNLPRATEADLLAARSDRGESLLLLAMCGNVLASAPHLQSVACAPSSSVADRVALLEFFKQRVGKVKFSEWLQMRSDELSAVQAFSLLCTTAASELSGTCSPGARSLAALQDEVFGGAPQESVAAAASCTSDVQVALLPGVMSALPAAWTPVHCAILADSKALLDVLLAHNVPMSGHAYVHFLAGLPATSSAVALTVLGAAAESEDRYALLNSPADSHPHTPLHLAVACRNLQFVENMLIFDHVDLNVADEASQRSAFAEAVVSGDVSLVKAFINAKSVQKLDLTAPDAGGVTCVEHALASRSPDMIEALSYDFSALCVEKLACVAEEGGESLLVALERENMDCCHKLGIFPAVQQEAEACEVSVEQQASREEGGEQGLVEGEGEQSQQEQQSQQELEQDQDSGGGEWLTDPEALKAATRQLEASNALLGLLLGLLQDAQVLGRDGHAHDCFFAGQLYESFCDESHRDGAVATGEC